MSSAPPRREGSRASRFRKRGAGSGLDYVSYALAIEALAQASATVAVSLVVHNSLVAELLAHAGTSAAQKDQWLRRLATGDAIGAFALSEPDAGTDAANQKTRAAKTSGGYHITGRKVWVANADAAAVAIVFACTRPGQRGQGVTAFLVPMDTPGITRTARADSLGVRGLGCMDLDFDIDVTDDQVLGSVDQGFRIAMWALQGGRVGIAAQALGIGEAAIDEAIAFAKARQAFGQPIANYQAIQWMLADAATELEAARMLTWKAADAKDRQERIRLEASMAKLAASEAGTQSRRQSDADSGVGRLSARIGGRAAVPRRSRDGDLSGHVRGAANDHRRRYSRANVIDERLLLSFSSASASFLAASLPLSSTDPAAGWKQQAQNVTIIRDDWGIPHVYGKTDADAVFGVMYAQAEDDFNRVETNYLNSMGRLAEAEGEAEIYRDLRMKLFIDPDDMKAQYAEEPGVAEGADERLRRRPELLPRTRIRT